MDKRSEVRKLEMAVRFVLMGLRECGGEMPRLRPRVYRAAARLLRLKALEGGWRADKDFQPFLDATGFDKDGHIIDYEKLYAYLDAHKAKPRKKLHSHNK